MNDDGDCSEDAEGYCTAMPFQCPSIFDPVCGCDGMTYDNACLAAAAGANVAYDGECEAQGMACGGGLLNTCDAEGICTVMPLACPTDHTPVCGCNGEVYFNECHADAAGVTVMNEGDCGRTMKSIMGARRGGWLRSN